MAEREASRLARPVGPAIRTLGHANRKKAAVTSTPFGVLPTKASSASSSHNNRGAESTEWCGPLAIARQMIAAREKARIEREEETMDTEETHPLDEAMGELEKERKRKEHPSLQWKPNTDDTPANTVSSWYAKRQRTTDQTRQTVPALVDLCLQFLVENFQYVESVGEIGPDVRQQIAAALVAQHKLDGMALHALVQVGMESLELLDCSSISGEEMQQTLEDLLPAGLRYLNLDQCGRCFGSKVVETLLKYPSSLAALSIGGAYLWKDTEAASVLREMTQLSSVDFKACPLLGLETFRALSTARSVPFVELALEDLTLQDDAWEALCTAKSLNTLERLKLCRVGGLNDEIVKTLLALTSRDGTCSLQALDLSNNYDLTDDILEPIRQHTSLSLRSLNLSGLGQLSADALEALFTVVEKASPPPRLKVLELADMDHQTVTDNVIQAALIAAADVREDSKATKYTTGGGVVRLNVQGARELSDATLEQVVKFCSTSIVEINVSYCTNLSDHGMGYLVDGCGIQLRNIELWGLRQLTDTFLEGHRRTKDPTLVLTGIWMRNSSSRAVQ